ncbi:MAG TPA: efflux RND transporter periplasmic adaptor subunit [Rudaea sp.]|nr:efflux RND transporter periplasmic adaptor subunit [Rudaea sp.]
MKMTFMKFSKCLFVGLFIAVMVSVSGCNHDSSAAQAAPAAVEAVPVEVALVGHNPIAATYSGTAALVADHDAQVVAQTGGVLKKLYVEEGVHVKAGQLLAELDDADTRAKAIQAEAQMHKAEATFAHAKAAIPNHLIAQFEYEQDKYDLAAQRAAYEGAKLQLSYTRIVAPVAGVISQRLVKVGNMIQTNQAMFTIVGMDPLQAVLNVPENQLGILKAGQSVQLSVDALPGKTFAGDILRIAPVVDAASGTFRVTCEFHNEGNEMRPGMFARIDIVYDQRADALTIPRSALIQEDGETAVFVVEKAPSAVTPASKNSNAVSAVPAKPGAAKTTVAWIAHRTPIKIGYSDGDKVEVLSGIHAGSRVITIGRNAVRDGTAILVLENKA